MQLVYKCGVSVPEPICQNRHVIAMGMIEGGELSKYKDLGKPLSVLREILRNVRRAYLKAHVIHADLSEYNIIVKPDGHVLIIDWPQYVTLDHANAEELLQRDLKNVLAFFSRRFNLDLPLDKACDYVSGKTTSLAA
jgi:RIO kinase 2